MVVVFSLDLRDDYATNPGRSMGAPGYLSVGLKAFAPALFAVVFIGILLLFASWMVMQKIGKAELKKRRENERANVASLSKKLDNTTSTLKRQKTGALPA